MSVNKTRSVIALSEIKWDPSVYPRSKWSTSTIQRYADAMLAGEEFPPIVLEDGTDRLIDGKHRVEAAKRAEIGELGCERHKIPDGVPIKLYAASLSVRHGDTITTADRKALAREIVLDDPEFNTVTLGKMLAVSDETARSYVGDILAKRREERAAKAFRLSSLGWTQADIGKVLGVQQARIAKDLFQIQELGKGIIEQLTSGLPIDEVAQRHGLPLQLVWAMALEGKDDAERLTELGIKTQPYDVWHFQSCHDLMGDTHPGRIPGELICHVLYFYTKPGDIIIDPMAGSGTTLDACLLMGRRCFGFDIDDRHERIDIISHDIAKDGWPGQTAKASLIFWDPPYFEKKDSEYVDGSVSRLDRDEYMAFFAKQFKTALAAVKSGTRMAFLMSDWDDEPKHKRDGIFVWDYAGLFFNAGWSLERHIQVPLNTQQVHPDIVNKFRAARRLARLGRYLLVARKV